MNFKKEIQKLQRNSIALKLGEQQLPEVVGSNRFGGAPDVPSDFVWPKYAATTSDGQVIEPHPLSFIAQFNCSDLSALDTECILPKTGVLAFFYEARTPRWGFDPKDKGCAKVFWFEDEKVLSVAKFPDDLEDEFRFSPRPIYLEREDNFPDFEDFALMHNLNYKNIDKFETVQEELGIIPWELSTSKVLGWPILIQNNITVECELASGGFYVGAGYSTVPKNKVNQANKHSLKTWRLLLQFSAFDEDENYSMAIGDGYLYFYIREEDLRAGRFDDCWISFQCD